MHTQEIFWTIAIIALLIICTLVIAALYFLYRFIKSLKQEVKGFFAGNEIKKIIDTIFGKGSIESPDVVIANLEQFQEGYTIGIQEFLQSAVNYCVDHLGVNEMKFRIELFIELANELEEIKAQGKFFLQPPDAENRNYRIFFKETAEKEQHNENKD